jgi:hypothetical protein
MREGSHAVAKTPPAIAFSTTGALTNTVRNSFMFSIKRQFARLMPRCYDCAHGT